ncbi:MAG: DUF547 domain-containing protein [Nitrospirae bacterium]|nr:DUF547 domain-containing protein [Nitrospirota bacterium]
MKKWVVPLVGGLLLVGCSAVPKAFHPAQPIAPGDFSHRAFDEVLQAHVKDGVVDYPSVAKDARFPAYLDQLNRVDPNALPDRRHRLACWINAYNAFAIKGILDGYSPLSLIGQWRYFIARTYPVGGESITLYDLEKKVLIPDFREPRIHFAIVCASQSCPKLRSQAFMADQLDAQLEENARAFINDLSKNRFDREQHVAYLSKIFEWFEPDFRTHAESLLNYVRRYVNDPELAADLAMQPYRIEFLEYDWRLNGVPYAGAP